MKKIISVIIVLAIAATFVFAGFAITESPLWSFVGAAWSMAVAYFGSQMLNGLELEEIEENDECTISEERA